MLSSTVSDSIKSETTSAKSEKWVLNLFCFFVFFGYTDKFPYYEVKSEQLNVKLPGDMNEILINDEETSIKTEQQEAEELMSTVNDPVRIVGTIVRLISDNEANKIAIAENVFRFLENEYPNLLNKTAPIFTLTE